MPSGKVGESGEKWEEVGEKIVVFDLLIVKRTRVAYYPLIGGVSSPTKDSLSPAFMKQNMQQHQMMTLMGTYCTPLYACTHSMTVTKGNRGQH